MATTEDKAGERNATVSGRLIAETEPLELEQALQNEMLASSNSIATPQNVVDAVGRTLELEACALFRRSRATSASLAACIPDRGLREALIRAYSDAGLDQDIFQCTPAGQAILVSHWSQSANVPGYVTGLLQDHYWTMSLELKDGDQIAGSVWLLGSSEGPPGKKQLAGVERLALRALQDAMGFHQTIRLRNELQLLEDLSAILAQNVPLRERLKQLAQRGQQATKFASVQVTTQDPTHSGAIIDALYVQELGLIRDPTPEPVAAQSLQSATSLFSRRPGPVVIANPADVIDELMPIQRRWMVDSGVKFVAIVPLVYADELLGTVKVCSAFEEARTWERLRVFTTLGSHLGAVLKSALLLGEVKASHHATVRMLAQAAEARDPFTGNHLRTIEAYSRALAEQVGLSEAEIEEISFGAVVHDVGKLRVPDAILLKPAKLNQDEREVIQQHPLYGEEILAESNIPSTALKIARWHHERWDGAGYPDRLRAEEIPITVQIVTLADVFDALTSVRPYKPAWPADLAHAEICEQEGRQLSPRAVDAFKALWNNGTIDALLRERDAHHQGTLARAAA